MGLTHPFIDVKKGEGFVSTLLKSANFAQNVIISKKMQRKLAYARKIYYLCSCISYNSI